MTWFCDGDTNVPAKTELVGMGRHLPEGIDPVGGHDDVGVVVGIV